MARFNCNDCVKFCTDGCRFGSSHRDYSDYCDDMLVEQNHAYEKAIYDFYDRCMEMLIEEDNRYGYLDGPDIRKIAEMLKGENECEQI